ncbi:hypothetical protein SM2011_b23184 (plasmid) [Sinorhizobium meliloti 2011]|nr:hypothetical protein SM2011_b23184 [Sinorhizobium meliloti 2011]
MPTDEATNDMRPIDREMGARLRSTRQVLGIGQQILAKKVGSASSKYRNSQRV